MSHRSRRATVKSEQGSIFGIRIEPRGVVELLRRSGLLLDIHGPADAWNKIIVTRTGAAPGERLTLRLKTRQTDSAYFRQQIPLMVSYVSRLPANNLERQQQLKRLAPHLAVCVGMVAEPTFVAAPEFLRAAALVARACDGLMHVPIGFIDSSSRALLLNDGTCDVDAVVPSLPEAGFDDDAGDIDAAYTSPTASRVAERMLVMLATAYRAAIELDFNANDRPAAHARLADWFWSLEVGHELEANESHMLNIPIGELSPDEARQYRGAFEDVAILAWGLRLTDMPTVDEQIDARRLGKTLGMFNTDARFIIDSADLRDPIDLRTHADTLLLIHWRLRDWLHRPTRRIDFQKVADEHWLGSIDTSRVPLINGDLDVGGRAIYSAASEVIRRCCTAVERRHRAINWLCGTHPIYSEVSVNT